MSSASKNARAAINILHITWITSPKSTPTVLASKLSASVLALKMFEDGHQQKMTILKNSICMLKLPSSNKPAGRSNVGQPKYMMLSILINNRNSQRDHWVLIIRTTTILNPSNKKQAIKDNTPTVSRPSLWVASESKRIWNTIALVLQISVKGSLLYQRANPVSWAPIIRRLLASKFLMNCSKRTCSKSTSWSTTKTRSTRRLLWGRCRKQSKSKQKTRIGTNKIWISMLGGKKSIWMEWVGVRTQDSWVKITGLIKLIPALSLLQSTSTYIMKTR